MTRPSILPSLVVATLLTSLVFYGFPQIDLWASRQFQSGGNFILEKGNRAAILTDIVHYGMRMICFACVGAGGILLAIGKAPTWLSWRKYLFIILCIALGPGLLTNVILKDHWGRARPNQIVQFGSTQHFTPAWVISDQCAKNCSFTGGDVSFAFCLLAPALLASRRRKLWISSVAVFGFVVMLVRLAAGAHFLSDCILAALLTAIIVIQLHKLFGFFPDKV